ncbi:hypothetical protein DFH09DRAFT_1086911 [Mycena vulgaris]|nr:hypothetical protein DFH09DRAFT_1086911 [Mycena vulgaris]
MPALVNPCASQRGRHRAPQNDALIAFARVGASSQASRHEYSVREGRKEEREHIYRPELSKSDERITARVGVELVGCDCDLRIGNEPSEYLEPECFGGAGECKRVLSGSEVRRGESDRQGWEELIGPLAAGPSFSSNARVHVTEGRKRKVGGPETRRRRMRNERLGRYRGTEARKGRREREKGRGETGYDNAVAWSRAADYAEWRSRCRARCVRGLKTQRWGRSQRRTTAACPAHGRTWIAQRVESARGTKERERTKHKERERTKQTREEYEESERTKGVPCAESPGESMRILRIKGIIHMVRGAAGKGGRGERREKQRCTRARGPSRALPPCSGWLRWVGGERRGGGGGGGGEGVLREVLGFCSSSLSDIASSSGIGIAGLLLRLAHRSRHAIRYALGPIPIPARSIHLATHFLPNSSHSLAPPTPPPPARAPPPAASGASEPASTSSKSHGGAPSHVLFLDIGVVRGGGRRGAKAGGRAVSSSEPSSSEAESCSRRRKLGNERESARIGVSDARHRVLPHTWRTPHAARTSSESDGFGSLCQWPCASFVGVLLGCGGGELGVMTWSGSVLIGGAGREGRRAVGRHR